MRRYGNVVLSLVGGALLCAVGTGCAVAEPKVQRFGQVIGVKAEGIPRYRELHAAPWPSVIQALRDAHIRNYSIYLKEVEPDKWLLFASFEYTGRDFDADMRRAMANPAMQEWLKQTDPLQTPLPVRNKGEWWANAEMVFHMD